MNRDEVRAALPEMANADVQVAIGHTLYDVESVSFDNQRDAIVFELHPEDSPYAISDVEVRGTNQRRPL